jgi:hypothetical protein
VEEEEGLDGKGTTLQPTGVSISQLQKMWLSMKMETLSTSIEEAVPDHCCFFYTEEDFQL